MEKIIDSSKIKILMLTFVSVICNLFYGQNTDISVLKKMSTLNNEKSLGLDINISYPKDWYEAEGQRPHILFNVKNNRKTIYSTFYISDLLENFDEKEKNEFSKLNAVEVNAFVNSTLPTAETCKEYFLKNGFDQFITPECNFTKIEGLQTSVSSAVVSKERAGFISKFYYILYQIPYETKIIGVAFSFLGIENSEDRILADLFAKKTMNTLVINNLWKKENNAR